MSPVAVRQASARSYIAIRAKPQQPPPTPSLALQHRHRERPSRRKPFKHTRRAYSDALMKLFPTVMPTFLFVASFQSSTHFCGHMLP